MEGISIRRHTPRGTRPGGREGWNGARGPFFTVPIRWTMPSRPAAPALELTLGFRGPSSNTATPWFRSPIHRWRLRPPWPGGFAYAETSSGQPIKAARRAAAPLLDILARLPRFDPLLSVLELRRRQVPGENRTSIAKRLLSINQSRIPVQQPGIRQPVIYGREGADPVATRCCRSRNACPDSCS